MLIFFNMNNLNFLYPSLKKIASILMFYISLRLSILPRPNYHFHQANVYKHPHLCTALLSSFIICTNLRYIFNLFYPL